MAYVRSTWRTCRASGVIPEGIKRPPLPDGKATPTKRGRPPEIGRPKEEQDRMFDESIPCIVSASGSAECKFVC